MGKHESLAHKAFPCLLAPCCPGGSFDKDPAIDYRSVRLPKGCRVKSFRWATSLVLQGLQFRGFPKTLEPESFLSGDRAGLSWPGTWA